MLATVSKGVSRGRYPLPWLTLWLAGLAATLFCFAGPGAEAWIYDHEAIARGEWWRLVTGHWVHGDSGHLLWNLLALVLLGWLLETLQWRWLALALGAGMAGVDAWLWWGDAGLRYYCGLSGILNSVLAAYLLLSWRAQRHPLMVVIAAGAVGKVLIEIVRQDALLTHTLWPSVPEVHAAGLLAGLLFAGFTTAGWFTAVIPRRLQSRVGPGRSAGAGLNSVQRWPPRSAGQEKVRPGTGRETGLGHALSNPNRKNRNREPGG